MQSKDLLGECPLWDEREQALWWVDIHGRAIKRYDGKLEAFPTPEPVVIRPRSPTWPPCSA